MVPASDPRLISPTPHATNLDRLQKVYASLARLMDDARERPDALRNLNRWIDIYDDNDELLKDNPPAWVRTAYRVVRYTLDQARPVLMAEPQQPGQLREILRAFVRLTRLLDEVRTGRVE